jgi:hypothetical protein
MCAVEMCKQLTVHIINIASGVIVCICNWLDWYYMEKNLCFWLCWFVITLTTKLLRV